MILRHAGFRLIIGLLLIVSVAYGAKDVNNPAKAKHPAGIAKKPVTPNATPEAVKLL